MYLGIKAVIVKSFARIHMANLVNVGILPLILNDPGDYAAFQKGDRLRLPNVRAELLAGQNVTVENLTRGGAVSTHVELSPRQVEVLLAGGQLNYIKLQTTEE